TKQLNKLVSVLTVTDLTKKDPIEHELVLFKINAEPEKLAEITQLTSVFNASIVDVGSKRVTIEAVGDAATLERLQGLLDAYGIVEVVRSGRVATARNAV
ncbi:MAG: acetolactate synthase small subunit, partial [Eggerthellaceae bacterium]|nr:acetolactate synthase small subunit [Eggerthellaceae bacterium]